MVPDGPDAETQMRRKPMPKKNGDLTIKEIKELVKPIRTLDSVIKLAKKYGKRKFEPCAWYNRVGDMLEVYFEKDNHFVRHINNTISLMLTRDKTPRVVGAYICGISKLVKESGGLRRR